MVKKNEFFSSPYLVDGMHELTIHMYIEPHIDDEGYKENDTASVVAVGKIIDTALKTGWKVRSRPIAQDEETFCDHDD
jgi:hypothetical protein